MLTSLYLNAVVTLLHVGDEADEEEEALRMAHENRSTTGDSDISAMHGI